VSRQARQGFVFRIPPLRETSAFLKAEVSRKARQARKASFSISPLASFACFARHLPFLLSATRGYRMKPWRSPCCGGSWVGVEGLEPTLSVIGYDSVEGANASGSPFSARA
jgi:hypothetical protein